MISKIEQYAIDKVKAKRLERGLSQAAFAAEVGLSYGFIGDVESSKRRAKYNLNHLNKFAVFFECSLHDFIPDQPFRPE